MAGAQLRYLLFNGSRLLGGLGFGASAWSLADRPLIGLPAFLELWDVANDPAQDSARGDADAEFPGQLGQLPVTKLKAQYHRTQVTIMSSANQR